MNIREIDEDDAEAFLALVSALDHETAFMMLEPGERNEDVGAMRARIRRALASDNSTIFVVADDGGTLLGYLQAQGGTFHRDRYTAYIVIGLRQAATGKGLGARLFAALERWATGHGLHRLELTVMTHNTRAVALYRNGVAPVSWLFRDLCEAFLPIRPGGAERNNVESETYSAIEIKRHILSPLMG